MSSELEMLLREVASNPIDYPNIVASCYSKTNQNDAQLSVIIPVYKRKEYLNATLRFLERSIQHWDPNMRRVRIHVVEMDMEPECNFVSDLGIDYTFIPTNFYRRNTFCKSLCFNVGYLSGPKTEWYLLHDGDIIMNLNFFTILERYFDKGNLIQPYNDLRVRRLCSGITNAIITDPNNRELYEEYEYELCGQGATGGSVLIKGELFKRIGGYDPELMWGWGPEDVLFWTKAETLSGEKWSEDPNPHKGNATYVEEQTVWHLEHPRLWNSNPRLDHMNLLFETFVKLPRAERLAFIERKEKCLSSLL
jgi:hypothetical protein